MMKQWICLLTSVCLAASMTACGGSGGDAAASGAVSGAAAASGDKITVKIGTTVSENNPTGQSLELLKSKAAELSGGRIDVQVFYSSQLGDETEMLTQTRQGDIQMYISNPVKTSGTITAHAALEGYFLYDDWDHAMRFLDSEAGGAMLKAYESMEMEGLAYFPAGFRQFTNNKRAINTVADLKGIKIRGYSESQIAAWESVGVNLSSIAWNELFTSLQQSLVDGQECAIAGIYDAKLYEVQPYLTLTEHQLSTDVLVANTKFMNGLSPEDKKMLLDAVDAAAQAHRENFVKAEEENLKIITDYGVKVNTLTPEVKAELREIIGKAVDPKIIAIAGQANYDLVQKSLEDTRTK